MDWQQLLLSAQGRMSRRQYWLYSILPVYLASLVFGLLAVLIDGVSVFATGNAGWGVSLYLLASIPLTWISVATTIKRWHDRGKSGWMTLVLFVPVVGGLWWLYECGALAGEEGQNQYGLDPRMFNVSEMSAGDIEDVTGQIAFGDDEDMMTLNESGEVVDFEAETFGTDLEDDFATDLEAELEAKFDDDFGSEVAGEFEDDFGAELSEEFGDDFGEEVSYVETGDAKLFEEEDGEIEGLGEGLKV